MLSVKNPITTFTPFLVKSSSSLLSLGREENKSQKGKFHHPSRPVSVLLLIKQVRTCLNLSVPEKGYNFLGKTDSLSLVLSNQTCPFFILSKREMRTTGCPANTEFHILSKDYSLIEGSPFMRRRWKRAGRVSNEYGIYRWRPCPMYKGW